MARPKVEVDEALVEKLASIHCTMEEISSVVGCSVDTLERRFADLIKAARAKGRSSIRRHQWEAAQKGNTSMLIWLGKQVLGQTEKLETHSVHSLEYARDVSSKTDAELMAIAKEKMKKLEGK